MTPYKIIFAHAVPQKTEDQEYNMILNNWEIKKHTSPYYPLSEGWAELAVKTAKQILAGSTDSYDHLCHDHVARSLLTHHNTPIQDLDMSPAMMLYSSVIKDHFPALKDKYQIHKLWGEIGCYRETAMDKRHMKNEKCYDVHCHPLQELEIGENWESCGGTRKYYISQPSRSNTKFLNGGVRLAVIERQRWT